VTHYGDITHGAHAVLFDDDDDDDAVNIIDKL